jgi:hypothetical protein
LECAAYHGDQGDGLISIPVIYLHAIEKPTDEERHACSWEILQNSQGTNCPVCEQLAGHSQKNYQHRLEETLHDETTL